MGAAGRARAQADAEQRSWNQPVAPYRIMGSLYYVGASDVTAFLITTPQGHILVDSGFAETVPLIKANIAKLGFELSAVKWLLGTHAHADHAGGFAQLKKETGAPLVAGADDAELLARGGSQDFAFANRAPYPAVKIDRPVHDGDTVSLGDVTLTAHATPGHTKGCITWTLPLRVDDKIYNVVFVGSASINDGVRLSGKPSYPGIAADYATTFKILKSLPCDIFLGSHARFYDGLAKASRLKDGGPNPFIDPQGYRKYIAGAEKVYLDQLARERAP